MSGSQALHDSIVNKIAEERGMRTTGLWAELRRLFDCHGDHECFDDCDEDPCECRDKKLWGTKDCCCDAKEFYHVLASAKFIPDAFRVDDEELVLWLLEVEKTSVLTESKLWKLKEFWFDLDCLGWDVRLLVATTSNSQNGKYVLSELDICGEYYKHLHASVAAEARNAL